MNLVPDLRHGVAEVARAVRRPEELAVRWRDRSPGEHPHKLVFAVLLLSAALGTSVFGLVTRLPHGTLEMLDGALRMPLATGAAWLVSLPALYIVNTALGSRLDVSTTVLASLISMSFGSMALLASVPVVWFFGLAVPAPWIRLVINVLVFGGVGVAMVDTFVRVMGALEPDTRRSYALVWLALVGVIGGELLVLGRVFTF